MRDSEGDLALAGEHDSLGEAGLRAAQGNIPDALGGASEQDGLGVPLPGHAGPADDAHGDGEGPAAGLGAPGARLEVPGASGIFGDLPARLILPSMLGEEEDFYPAVVITALLRVLKDPAFAPQHKDVLIAVTWTFRTLGLRCTPFLPFVVPSFLAILAREGAGSTLRQQLLGELTVLVSLVRHHMRPYLPAIVALLLHIWIGTPPAAAAAAAATAAAAGGSGRVGAAALATAMRARARAAATATAAAGKAKTDEASAAAAAGSAGGVPLGGATTATMAAARAAAAAAAAAAESGGVNRAGGYGGGGGIGPAGATASAAAALLASLETTGGPQFAAANSLLPSLLQLIRTLAGVLQEEVRPFLPVLLPAILAVLRAPTEVPGDEDVERGCEHAIHAIHALGPLLRDHMAAVVPAVAAIVECRRSSVSLRASAALCVGHLARAVPLGGLSSRVVHCFARVLADEPAPAVAVGAAAAAAASGFVSATDSTALAADSRLDARGRLLGAGVGGALSGGFHGFSADDVDPHASASIETSRESLEWVASLGLVARSPLSLKTACLDALCLVLAQMRGDFLPFIPLLRRAVLRGGRVRAAASASAIRKLSDGAAPADPTAMAAIRRAPPIRHAVFDRLVALLLESGGAILPPDPLQAATTAAAASGAGIGGGLGAPLGAGLSVFARQFAQAARDTAQTSHSSAPGGVGGGGGGGGDVANAAMGRRLTVNQHGLRRAWETHHRTTRGDWREWLRKLSVELLRESPAPALRSCCALAQVLPPLARDLFNAAFISCWSEISGPNQAKLVDALESAFQSPSCPTDVLTQLLELAEFAERDERPLPIPIRTLGALAERCRAYAKALRYRELEWDTDPAYVVEPLISINNVLGQPEAAVGVLKLAQRQQAGVAKSSEPLADEPSRPARSPTVESSPKPSGDSPKAFASPASPQRAGGWSAPAVVEVKETWYERLGRWDDALEAYTSRLAERPRELRLVLGQLNCLKELGQWSRLSVVAAHTWPLLARNAGAKRKIAPLAAQAAWALGKWSDMAELTAWVDENTSLGRLLRAVLAVRQEDLVNAQRQVDAARVSLAPAGESYVRSYDDVITLQLLAEVEEIVTYLGLRRTSGLPPLVGVSSQTHLNPTSTSVFAGSGAPPSWNGTSTILALPEPVVDVSTLPGTHPPVGLARPLLRSRPDVATSASTDDVEEGAPALYLAHIRRLWSRRLNAARRSASVWHRVLAVRSLVPASDRSDIEAWLRFAGLCRREGRTALSRRVLLALGMDGRGGLASHVGRYLAGHGPAVYASPVDEQREVATSREDSPLGASDPTILWNAGLVVTGLGGPADAAARAAAETDPDSASALDTLSASQAVSTSLPPPYLLHRLSSDPLHAANIPWTKLDLPITTAPPSTSTPTQTPSHQQSPSASPPPYLVPLAAPRSAAAARDLLTPVNARTALFDPSAFAALVDAQTPLPEPPHPRVVYEYLKHSWDVSTSLRPLTVVRLTLLAEALDSAANDRLAAKQNRPLPSLLQRLATLKALLSSGGEPPKKQEKQETEQQQQQPSSGGEPPKKQKEEPSSGAEPSKTQKQEQSSGAAEPPKKSSSKKRSFSGELPSELRGLENEMWRGPPSSLRVSDVGYVWGAGRVLSEAEEKDLRTKVHLRLGEWRRSLAEGAVATTQSRLRAVAPVAAAAAAGSASLSAAVRQFGRTPLLGGAGVAVGLGGVPFPEKSLADDVSSSEVAAAAKEWDNAAGPLAAAARSAVEELNAAAEPILASLGMARLLGPGHYRAWHAWALSNFEAAQRMRSLASAAAAAAKVAKQEAEMHVGDRTRAAAATKALQLAGETAGIAREAVARHVAWALTGFTRSIALGRALLKPHVLQDLLRLLTLWFDFGESASSDVRSALDSAVAQVRVATWLRVIPQLIARVHLGDTAPRTSGLLMRLLARIGREHPQALVYPLTVASKSASGRRRRAAQDLLGGLRRHWLRLVEEAETVSRELIRAAILWSEEWHTTLEEASRQYFAKHDARAMLAALIPLHERVAAGAETPAERRFIEAYGARLEEAAQYLARFQATGRASDVTAAWDTYFRVYKELAKEIKAIKSLSLQDESPALLTARNLELAVPGTYSPVAISTSAAATRQARSRLNLPEEAAADAAAQAAAEAAAEAAVDRARVEGVTDPVALHEAAAAAHALASAAALESASASVSSVGESGGGNRLVRIVGFSPHIDVIASKQRPRRIVLLGSDGRRYAFLLKGHEDLRQDERVMQLFGLVNTLLATDAGTSHRDLAIRRYAVTPLSHNAGVVGWVPSCDTLNALIRQHRDNRGVTADIERRLIYGMAPMYEHLTVLQKVEVFQHALNRTSGTDLQRVLWLRSSSSEVWLHRRTNYTRSLAVMSMVGYVLGLGDRHPSNLMLDRRTGKVLHIDFGDCFEVAMTRDTVPERVPFRLTRMLISAMEIAGIEGAYRTTAEAVMHVLRANRDSVMAMLEAFVLDPLINWRLLTPDATQSDGVQPPEARGDARQDPDAADDEMLNGAERIQREVSIAAAESAGLDPSMVTSSSLAQSVHVSRGALERALARALGPEGAGAPVEALNARALAVTSRVRAKLTGRDFGPDGQLSVPEQVQRLISQATSHTNLAVSYLGWCPYW